MNREDLFKYRNNQEWIEKQLRFYKEQLSIAEGIHSSVIDGMPKAYNKPSYALENLIDSLDEMVRYFTELQRQQNEINKQLGELEDSTYRTILFYKYIYNDPNKTPEENKEARKLESISLIIGYNYTETCRKHGYALNEFDKLDKLRKKTQDNTTKNIL